MIRAWNALDAEATKAGAPPLAPTVWETVLPQSGEVVAIVRDSEEALAVAKDRKGAVWTLAEVAVAIEAFGEPCARRRQRSRAPRSPQCARSIDPGAEHRFRRARRGR